MGFHAYSSPYDWSRIAGFKATAKTVPGGMIDLSVGSPVDPVPSSVQQALVAGADAPNAHGYPVTAGTADLKAAIDTWFRELRGVDLKSINAAAVPTVGSKEAVALMASLLHLGEGDVVGAPQYSRVLCACRVCICCVCACRTGGRIQRARLRYRIQSLRHAMCPESTCV